MRTSHSGFKVTWGQAVEEFGERHGGKVRTGVFTLVCGAFVAGILWELGTNGMWKREVSSMADIAVKVGKHQRMRGDWLVPDEALETSRRGDISATLERSGDSAVLRLSGFSSRFECARTGKALDDRLRGVGIHGALNGHLAVRLEPVYECPAPDTLAMHLTAPPASP